MKKYITLICLFVFSNVDAQNSNFKYYLILGIEKAEDLTSNYVSPLTEGLMYGLTGGWYNSAIVDKPWSVDFSLISNGSFVPKDKLSRQVDISGIDNLRVVGGGNIIDVPTILGSSNSNVNLIATLNGEDYEFELPTGIGLVNINLLPSAFLQGSVGLPFNSEVVVRFIPKVEVDDVSAGIFGIGIKNELSKLIKPLDNSKIAIAGMIAYTGLNAEYRLDEGIYVTGDDHRIEVKINTYMFDLITSTKFEIYNAYAGLGYVVGDADYTLKGHYHIENRIQNVTYTDPFDVQNDISGIRFNVGGKVRMGWFSLNLDYTFQGYNNLSLGLNFDIYNRER